MAAEALAINNVETGQLPHYGPYGWHHGPTIFSILVQLAPGAVDSGSSEYGVLFNRLIVLRVAILLDSWKIHAQGPRANSPSTLVEAAARLVCR